VVSFLLAFPPTSYMNFSLPPFILHALPISSSLTYHSNYVWWGVQVWRVSLCSFLQPPITSLSLNILPSALFSNTLNLFSSINVTDQVSHPYRTTGKIIVFYILILCF
jgi:hypothetical protein